MELQPNILVLDLWHDVLKTDNPALLTEALAQWSAQDSHFTLDSALREAVSSSAPLVLTELMSRGGDVRRLGEYHVSTADRSSDKIIEVLEILVANGWDMNQRNVSGSNVHKSKPVLWSFVNNEDVLMWCLEHGASVHARGEAVPTPSNDRLRCPTILEKAAGYGTVRTFELLRERGAPLGTRPLQEAVETATFPAHSQHCSHSERMAMVRHLVGTLNLDVNASDEFGEQPGRSIPGRWGTAIDYAFGPWSLGRDNTDLVMYLVDHGADATRALGYARADNLEQTILALEAWMSRPKRRRWSFKRLYG